MTDFDTRLVRDCCWVKKGSLLAGAYPASGDHDRDGGLLAKYLRVGVTFFLDLTEDGELVPYDTHLPAVHPVSGAPVAYRRMQMPDMEASQSAREMNRILDAIDSAIKAGHVVYVHCRYGFGRTGMVVGCYLVRHGMGGEAALKELSDLWRSRSEGGMGGMIPQTYEQRRYVLNWSENGNGFPRPRG